LAVANPPSEGSFQEIKRFGSERSAVGVDVLSQLVRTGLEVRSHITKE
jgi:hypothetical protein